MQTAIRITETPNRYNGSAVLNIKFCQTEADFAFNQISGGIGQADGLYLFLHEK